MGSNHTRCYPVDRFECFFFTQKIGEYAYGFTADSEEEINGDSITVYGSTVIADAADFIKAFPQYRLNDYLYRLSCAQIQFLAVDNTHTKYLKGADKKAMETYKEVYKATKSFDTFFDSLGVSSGEGGRKDIPVKTDRNKKKNKENNK